MKYNSHIVFYNNKNDVYLSKCFIGIEADEKLDDENIYIKHKEYTIKKEDIEKYDSNKMKEIAEKLKLREVYFKENEDEYYLVSPNNKNNYYNILGGCSEKSDNNDKLETLTREVIEELYLDKNKTDELYKLLNKYFDNNRNNKIIFTGKNNKKTYHLYFLNIDYLKEENTNLSNIILKKIKNYHETFSKDTISYKYEVYHGCFYNVKQLKYFAHLPCINKFINTIYKFFNK